MMHKIRLHSLFLVAAASCTIVYRRVDGFVVPPSLPAGPVRVRPTPNANANANANTNANSPWTVFASSPSPPATDNSGDEISKPPAPVLNGKRILPLKIMLAGLKGHQLAATYAVLGPGYKKNAGTEGWEACQHVGTTRDLAETLRGHLDDHGSDRVAHVRALSFLIPNESAMESIAFDWRKEVFAAKGMTNFDPILAAMDMDDLMDDDDDDDDDFDDDDDDDYFEMMAGALSSSREQLANARGIEEPTQSNDDEAVVSPFDQPKAYTTTDGESLSFTKDNVDKVLDEIRPYLISDGGNVSVDRVDEETKSVYLVLEGACGSCPSSTVTMQMGIERVLKENFADLGEVLQVDDSDGAEDQPKELTYQVVEKEVNRIKPAIIAMGGLVDILEVDAIGTIKLRFRGANKIRQGLEMALLDIDFVKHIEFVME